MTEIALPWEEVPADLPIVISVGGFDREFRKRALRAGADEELDLRYRNFQEGSAHPVQHHASIVDMPGGGSFTFYDAGRVWEVEMSRPGVYARYIANIVDACRRASAIVFPRIDAEFIARAIAGIAAACNVPKVAVWVDASPKDPSPEDRAKESTKLAKEFFRKVEVFHGDLKAVADCQCGKESCEVCGPWKKFLDFATQPRSIPDVDFRLSVDEITGWGVKPHTRIVRGIQRGSVDVGDEIEVHAAGERYTTEVEDVARGGVVFTLGDKRSDDIDAIAKPGSLDFRDVVAARAMGEPQGTSGEAFVDGSSRGRVSVGTVGKKRILRFSRRIPFRRGDVVSVLYRDDSSRPYRADSYVILDD